MAATKKTEKKHGAPPQAKARPAEAREAAPVGVKASLAAVGAFIILRAAITLWHPADLRLWGIDFAAWLDSPLLLQLLLWLPLLFLLPQIAGLFTRSGKPAANSEPSGGRRILPAALFTLFAGVLAWQVQVAYAFLGDGTWYVAELFRSMTLADYANSMIKPSAWLTGLLLDGFARAFRPDDIRLPFVLAGVAGMLVAAGAVLFSTRRESPGTALATALIFLGGSGTLMFFGYIELYAIVYALSIAYLVTAWQCLRGNAPLWLPVLLLVLSLLFGATSIVWLPSLLLLLHWKFRGEEGSLPLRNAAVLLMLLPVAGAVLLYLLGSMSGDSAYLVALTPYERTVEGLRTGWQRYVLFSPQRWIDIVNMLLLGLGVLAFVLPVLMVLGKKGKSLRRPTVLFGATAAAGGLTLLLFGNTFLGLARDWDVGAFALLGMLMLTLALWTESVSAAYRRRLLPALTAVIVSQLLLWTLVNTEDRASAGRFESIAVMDDGLLLPMNSFTAYENLRKYYQSGGESQAYFRVLRRQIGTGYRSHIGYAEYLSSVLQLRDAAQRSRELDWLFNTYLLQFSRGGAEDDFRTIQTQDAREYAVRLLLSAWQIGERETVARYEQAFQELLPEWPEHALLNILRTPAADAKEDLQRIAAAVTETTRDAFLHMTAGGLYQQRGVYEKAAEEYSSALEREPSLYPSWYLVAADLHLKFTGDRQSARKILQDCIAKTPSSTEAGRARELLMQF